MKNIFLLGCTLSILMSSTTFAQNQQKEKDDINLKNFPVKITDGVTIVTLQGQNTNGEDLKCAVYEAFGNNGGAGGISCNWTPAHVSRKK